MGHIQNNMRSQIIINVYCSTRKWIKIPVSWAEPFLTILIWFSIKTRMARIWSNSILLQTVLIHKYQPPSYGRFLSSRSMYYCMKSLKKKHHPLFQYERKCGKKNQSFHLPGSAPKVNGFYSGLRHCLHLWTFLSYPTDKPTNQPTNQPTNPPTNRHGLKHKVLSDVTTMQHFYTVSRFTVHTVVYWCFHCQNIISVSAALEFS